MFLQSILHYLDARKFVSGEVLAEHLGISRMAVNKQIAHARDCGVQIDSVKGRGYRLAYPLEWIDIDAFVSTLNASTGLDASFIEVFERIDSTNDYLMCKGDDAEHVVVAECQIGGHGRRGRQWLSPYAAGVYASVQFPVNALQQVPPYFSLLMGIALAEVLNTMGVSGIALKWPNDILRHGKKLGGILIEVNAQSNGPGRLVVGFGLNVLPSHLADEADYGVADCADVWEQGFRNELLVRSVSMVITTGRAALSGESSDWAARWGELDAYRGKQVIVHQHESNLLGVASGVDEQGALLIETDEGQTAVQMGDVSLRLQQ